MFVPRILCTIFFFLSGKQLVHPFTTSSGVSTSPSEPKPEEKSTPMMVEELSSPQQQSPSQIIQSGWLEPEGTELAVGSIEVEEDVSIIKVTGEVPQDRGLEVQVLF